VLHKGASARHLLGNPVDALALGKFQENLGSPHRCHRRRSTLADPGKLFFLLARELECHTLGHMQPPLKAEISKEE
jgi:hypothetical protein